MSLLIVFVCGIIAVIMGGILMMIIDSIDETSVIDYENF